MNSKVLDEAVEVAVVAYWEDCANGPGYEDSYTADRGHMRAALLAGVKVLLGPVVADWRAAADLLEFTAAEAESVGSNAAAYTCERKAATIRQFTDRLESIYAPQP